MLMSMAPQRNRPRLARDFEPREGMDLGSNQSASSLAKNTLAHLRHTLRRTLDLLTACLMLGEVVAGAARIFFTKSVAWQAPLHPP